MAREYACLRRNNDRKGTASTPIRRHPLSQGCTCRRRSRSPAPKGNTSPHDNPGSCSQLLSLLRCMFQQDTRWVWPTLPDSTCQPRMRCKRSLWLPECRGTCQLNSLWGRSCLRCCSGCRGGTAGRQLEMWLHQTPSTGPPHNPSAW